MGFYMIRFQFWEGIKIDLKGVRECGKIRVAKSVAPWRPL